MKVLVIGNGGREHAIIWKLKQSPKIEKIFVTDNGNPGINEIAEPISLSKTDFPFLADFVQHNNIDYTIVGPEQPLALGIVNFFKSKNLRIFGPTKEGAQIESSKIFAKNFMKKYNIPTADFNTFSNPDSAIDFLKNTQYPVVIKADGLAAGKGAVIVKSFEEAKTIIEKFMIKDIFSGSGKKIVVEELLQGEELSILAITDGNSFQLLLPSQDHKQVFDGDKGPNTGGMGAFAPVPFIKEKDIQTIKEKIISPTIEGFKKEKIEYKGVLYAGLMMTNDGPKVIEFNCRMGDPETQVVLPLLKTDLIDIVEAVCNDNLSNITIENHTDKSAIIVILASGGYPGVYEKNKKITGLDKITDPDIIVFHAGTKKDLQNNLLTNGGRVLGITAVKNSLEEAYNAVYNEIKKIHFENMHYRKDISKRKNLE